MIPGVEELIVMKLFLIYFIKLSISDSVGTEVSGGASEGFGLVFGAFEMLMVATIQLCRN